MARKAFLYTGAAFLVIMTLLISANYLFLSKHTTSESKTVNMQVDIANSLVSDTREVLFLNKNNTAADALSDMAFFFMTPGLDPSIISGVVDKAMNPTRAESENGGTNFTKWFLNYAKLTISDIKRSSPIPVYFSTPIVNSLAYVSKPGKIPINPPLFYRYFIGNYTYNITFEINVSADYFIRLNQTFNFSKVLEIGQFTDMPNTYCIRVYDGYTAKWEFSKQIQCDPVPCVPRPKTRCS